MSNDARDYQYELREWFTGEVNKIPSLKGLMSEEDIDTLVKIAELEGNILQTEIPELITQRIHNVALPVAVIDNQRALEDIQEPLYELLYEVTINGRGRV